MNRLKKKFKKIYAKMISNLIYDRDKRIRVRKILSESKRGSIKREWTEPKSHCSHLISVSGEGHSGSGAVIDFLREFDNCSVSGGIDENGIGPLGKTIKNDEAKIEFTIFRDSYGILDLEKYIAAGLLNSDIINHFVGLSERFYVNNGGIYNDKYMELMWEFVDQISDKKKLSGWDIGYASFCDDEEKSIPTNISAPYLVYPSDIGYTFASKKDLTLDVYRQRAQIFLDKVFKTIESKEYLVLDQFIGPNVSDDTIKNYVKDLKRLHVYRDPRDVFATAILLDVPWLPKKVDEFINSYKRMRERLVIGENKNIMYISFEDLVFNYEQNIKKIMDFCGLKEENHIYKKGFFDPNVSRKNIGLYKKLDNQDDIRLIEKAFNL
ncbi:MAG: sulfotransferase domain-containing protein [Elusimicrobiota bacterium]|jgi:hypothetical protein|nr:sulfotransferase domain-containing protein [Elusimicrobiota bacterium]